MKKEEEWKVDSPANSIENEEGGATITTTTKRMHIAISTDAKKLLQEMSNVTGIPQANLAQMAVVSMLENYKVQGLAIFSGLLKR